MDIEERIELIKKDPTEEIITEEELRRLLETKNNPIAYDGFEPSGLAPIHFALLRAIKLQDMLDAGCKFKLLLADWHAWINNKMGGDLEKIRKVGEYFIEVWKAAGIDINKVEVIWASDIVKNSDYWKLVIKVAKKTTLKRILRCLTIMGRKIDEIQESSQLFYPAMQVADIFTLKTDICQLGMDQRRANILAREVGPSLGLWKPVAVHHHMLMGLKKPSKIFLYDDDKRISEQISCKMSKSIPESCLYVHDSSEEIRNKIQHAYCPPKTVENNPILEYVRYIIFRKKSSFLIKRSSKFGGDVEYFDYSKLEKDFLSGKLHPQDLKNAVSDVMEELIRPIREHFEKDKKARELYEFVKTQEITR
ncbi:MAG: tyrosine--tRNA ligase [Candidatus Parvarchaeota archaeon]|nr:tyrosine--tRNA ligase [Candidatus Jingweiarchaeum tengchongense]MCW1297836.1 tyrosine--tRNA ligase [Candidatus Jingweiarchaeum tengchongense]MCW1299847.1 tyrosine--tRNA ligase [Candidatus Jingweiarchaeum tengchongense]MCW1304183.1 tyrosine--tRNA ligase [Candidatus Jingweiarchaeum tengchongense]MCW1305211.1 tyrosine--tRNA ligase [Candidatus Jingweiarchaeum tengchongense]